MKRLVMLLVVVMFCVPVYGEILIYKVRKTTDYIDEDGETFSERDRGYLVIDVNLAEIDDANAGDTVAVDGASLIQYDKDEGVKWQCRIEDVSMDIMKGEGKKWFVFLEEDFCNMEGILSGKVRKKNIGTDGKENVMTSLKGTILFLPADGEGMGLMKFSAKLKRSWTKEVNSEGKLFGEEVFDEVDVQDEIAAYLEDKGYEDEGDCCPEAI